MNVRFLRARKFDVPKAKEMLLNAEKWRKEFGVDKIVKCVPVSLPFFEIIVIICPLLNLFRLRGFRTDTRSIGNSISKRKKK